jgi:cytoskeletal protein RodZ
LNKTKEVINKLITYAKNNKKKTLSITACSLFIILFLCASIIAYVHKTRKTVSAENVVTTEETTIPTTEITSEETTVIETTTETTTLEPCHFNADGKLYGTKGKFSGLWPTLETIVNSSDEKWTALKEWVGDNSELQKSDYEEDKFVAINGYGTVHWSQGGHNWYAPYSIADTSTGGSATLMFESIAKEKVTVDLDKAVAEQEEKHKDIIPVTEAATEAATTAVSQDNNKSSKSAEKSTEKATEKATEKTSKSEKATTTTKEAATQATTAEAKPNEPAVSDTAVEAQSQSSSAKTNNTGSSGTGSSTGRYVYSGGVWGSDACGVCSLAMVLSTLSGVTVSPPEVALAANALIGEKAWYRTILYSQSQAKLAELAGFTVKTQPYNKATKEAMDECLDNNGMALFVTDKQTWASGGGKHYIAVRNRVGDKYYTCDSGKNPTGAFSYEEISSGYNQQLIVYIFPKGYEK